MWVKQHGLNSESELHEQLSQTLPLSPWTAEQELAQHLARLAGLRPTEADAQEPNAILRCCAEYTRSLQTKNQESFFDRFQLSRKSVLLFCSTLLLGVYQDYAADSSNGFFAILLGSQLVRSMAAQMRSRWEMRYVLPEPTEDEIAVEFRRNYRIWALQKDQMDADKEEVKPIAPKAVLAAFGYTPRATNPFTPIEELLYLEAFLKYKTAPRNGPRRNIGSIAELMPRHSPAECIQHHYALKTRLAQPKEGSIGKRTACSAPAEEAPPSKMRRSSVEKYSRSVSLPSDSAVDVEDGGYQAIIVPPPYDAPSETERLHRNQLAQMKDALENERNLRASSAAEIFRLVALLAKRDEQLRQLGEEKDTLMVQNEAELNDMYHHWGQVDTEFRQEKRELQEVTDKLGEQLVNKDLDLQEEKNHCQNVHVELSQKAVDLTEKAMHLKNLRTALIEGSYVLASEKDRELGYAYDENSHTMERHERLMTQKDLQIEKAESAKAAAERGRGDLREEVSSANKTIKGMKEKLVSVTKIGNDTSEKLCSVVQEKEQLQEELNSVVQEKEQLQEKLLMAEKDIEDEKLRNKPASTTQQKPIGPFQRSQGHRISQLEDLLRSNGIEVPPQPLVSGRPGI